MRRPEEVFILVRRGEEFLVLHRSPRQGSYWHCVAGALEPGESFAEAAARELQEETGLIAEPVDVDREFVYSLAQEPERWEPRLDWEHDDYRWLGAAEATDLLYWPEPAQVLRELAG